MTWNQWVNSKYNTGGFSIDVLDRTVEKLVSGEYLSTLMTLEHEYVYYNDIIIANSQYIEYSSHAGGEND